MNRRVIKRLRSGGAAEKNDETQHVIVADITGGIDETQHVIVADITGGIDETQHVIVADITGGIGDVHKEAADCRRKNKLCCGEKQIMMVELIVNKSTFAPGDQCMIS